MKKSRLQNGGDASGKAIMGRMISVAYVFIARL